MSGHSKWSKIQHKKGKIDKARSNIFTKLTRAVTVAAGQGGGDPDMNFGLRLAIDKAKVANVPKDNIERAIKRGIGELEGATTVEEILYEAFGPSGVAIIIEAVTDNKNRAVAEIKYVLSKYGGSLAGPGSVKWQFSLSGIVSIDKEQLTINKIDRDNLDLDLIEAGADDIIESEFGLEVHCPRESFQKVLEVIKFFNIEPADSSLQWVANEELKLDEESSRKTEELCDALDELDDVNNVYTNEK